MQSPRTQVAIVIPAFKPGCHLLGLVSALVNVPFAHVVIVNDGSGPAHDGQFAELSGLGGVTLLRHAVNLGKGAALKTAINYVAWALPGMIGVVTADADGQHHLEDILTVADALTLQPEVLVLGVRAFDGQVPLRSRLGNQLTRGLTRAVIGWNLSDTQTGLRGIPRRLFPVLLRMSASGYEFELDMLIAARHHKYEVVQVPIRTIYLDGNQESHFDPLRDSMRIYFVLLRFGIVSALTAVVDNGLFIAAFNFSNDILVSQIIGRLGGIGVNYTLARKAVFLSGERHQQLLPRYLALVLLSGAVSYSLIGFLHGVLGLKVIAAKLLAEAILFIANFCIQRDFVFRRRQSSTHMNGTDWNNYYQSVPVTAQLTRKYTTSVLLQFLRRYQAPFAPPNIVEIGGANSCFIDAVIKAIKPLHYSVIDNNEFGLNLLRQKSFPAGLVSCRNQDVLSLAEDERADFVFSVGLIEHFKEANTRLAIQSHFRLLKPGGIAIISFPTPTFLYDVARKSCELAGLWKFHDERPLRPEEVETTIAEEGEILQEKTLWPLILTQRVIVARKRTR